MILIRFKFLIYLWKVLLDLLKIFHLGACFITIIPPENEVNRKSIDWYISEIKIAINELKIEPASFLWIEGGK